MPHTPKTQTLNPYTLNPESLPEALEAQILKTYVLVDLKPYTEIRISNSGLRQHDLGRRISEDRVPGYVVTRCARCFIQRSQSVVHSGW